MDGGQHLRLERGRSLRIAAPALGGKGLPQRTHQRSAAEHEIDAVRGHRLGKLAMEIGAARPEFQHVAEDGDTPAARADPGLAEQGERGAHGRRIGVIAFVDEERAAVAEVERDARATSGRRLHPGQRQRRQREIGAHERYRRQHRQRIEHEVFSRRAELVGDLSAEDARHRRRAFRMQRVLEQARVGFGMLSEGNDASDARALRVPLQPREMRVVAVDRRCTTRLDPGEDFRLGVGDRFDRAEEFEMHRLDRGDDRHVRAHQPGERLDLAGVIHAQFEHGIERGLRAAGKRQRHAPVIVVRGDRRMGLAFGRERDAQRLLGRGLADRAGDADYLRR